MGARGSGVGQRSAAKLAADMRGVSVYFTITRVPASCPVPRGCAAHRRKGRCSHPAALGGAGPSQVDGEEDKRDDDPRQPASSQHGEVGEGEGRDVAEGEAPTAHSHYPRVSENNAGAKRTVA